MALDFPTPTTVGQIYTQGSLTYIWDGTKWVGQGAAAVVQSKIEKGNTSAEVVDTGSDGQFKVTTEGTQRLTVDSSGRLLVGTTTAYGSSDNFVVQKTDGGARIGLQRSDTGQVTAGEELGAITFYSNDGDLNPSAQISAQADLAHAASDKPGRLTFSTTADGAATTTDRMVIDSSGRVGIGSSTINLPSGTGLQVYDASTPRLKLANSTTGTGATDGSYLYVSGSDFLIENKESANMRFYTDATERLRIDSSGNVFIGGTTASSADIALNANGSATFGASIDLTDSTVDLYSQTTNSNSKTFQLFSDIGGTKTEKVFITAAGTATFAGTVTANAFSGDGSALTNLPSAGVSIGLAIALG